MKDKLLQDKVAIVTGATAGIGRAIALKFAENGAKVALLGRNEERGVEVVQKIGENARFFSVDVSLLESVKKVIGEVIDTFGEVDILVNNAGITRDGLFMRMKESDFDDVMTTNLKSCYNTCVSLVRSMMKRRQGKIINISSVVGLTGNAGQVNYSASKAGIIGFTKALAKELASRNIQVNSIAPGFIETKMTDVLADDVKKKILEKIPMGRMGCPEEIANTALFLASSLSSYITGQVITVDGGMVM